MSRLIAVGVQQASSWFRDLEMQYGNDITSTSHLKAPKEAQEFADDPSLEEAADVILCIIGACFHRGWSLRELGQAIIAKVLVNRDRTWHKEPDGTWQHD